MLSYVSDIQFADDDLLERSRRVEIYRSQFEGTGMVSDPRFRSGPRAARVFCDALSRRFPDGFRSVREAARWLGVERSVLRKAIRRGRPCQGYLFYLSGQRSMVKCGRERAVLCLNTGEVLGSIREAARRAQVSRSSLSEALRGSRGMPASCGGRLWQYLRKPRPIQLALFDALPGRARRPRIVRPKLTPALVQLELFHD